MNPYVKSLVLLTEGLTSALGFSDPLRCHTKMSQFCGSGNAIEAELICTLKHFFSLRFLEDGEGKELPRAAQWLRGPYSELEPEELISSWP
jgi:hypothetical protein